jgi:hypothetical protein
MPDPSRLVESPPPTSTDDPWLYRIVVGCLGAAVILTLIAAFVLAMLSKDVPSGLIAIGGSAGGGLVGLLAPSPRAN